MANTLFRVIPGSLRQHFGAEEIGSVPGAETVSVLLLLRYPPSAPRLKSLAELSQTTAPLAASVSRANFAATHAASPDDVQKVKDFAQQFGLTVVDVKPAERLIRLSGNAAKVNQAFQVKLKNFRTPTLTYRSHTQPVSIPASLEGIVTGVFGLDTHPAVEPRGLPHDLTAETDDDKPRPAASDTTAVLPTEIAAAYDFPSGTTGKGQTIGVVELSGGFKTSTLSTYFSQHSKTPMPNIVTVNVAGGSNNPASSSASEVYLDLEVIGSVAPGATMVVYFGGTSYDAFLATVKAAVHDTTNNNSVISISWGGPEHPENTMYTNAMNEALQEAANFGTTVCASSGDDGSSDQRSNPDGLAHVNFPASSPFALCCGGTTLTLDSGKVTDEVVWNSMGNATGGGVSAAFPPPPYQTTAAISVTSVNPGAGPGRGVPDVAGSADRYGAGYLILIDGVSWLIASGGTSAVAPLWAALIARINEQLGRKVGFINPVIYQQNVAKNAFRNVTEGANNVSAKPPGYQAGPGWDACTGWGSPIGGALLAALTGGGA
jgi:kumamolisin